MFLVGTIVTLKLSLHRTKVMSLPDRFLRNPHCGLMFHNLQRRLPSLKKCCCALHCGMPLFRSDLYAQLCKNMSTHLPLQTCSSPPKGTSTTLFCPNSRAQSKAVLPLTCSEFTSAPDSIRVRINLSIPRFTAIINWCGAVLVSHIHISSGFD